MPKIKPDEDAPTAPAPSSGKQPPSFNSSSSFKQPTSSSTTTKSKGGGSQRDRSGPEEGVPPPEAVTPVKQEQKPALPLKLSPATPTTSRSRTEPPARTTSTPRSPGGTPQARFDIAEIKGRKLVAYDQGQAYRCTHRCVLRKGFSLDSPKVGLLEVGDVCYVTEARLNEARTTRIKLAEPGSKQQGGGGGGGGSMYYAPGERWTSATMTDGTLSVQPLLEVQCIKRTVLRTGYGTHYSPSYPSVRGYC